MQKQIGEPRIKLTLSPPNHEPTPEELSTMMVVAIEDARQELGCSWSDATIRAIERRPVLFDSFAFGKVRDRNAFELEQKAGPGAGGAQPAAATEFERDFELGKKIGTGQAAAEYAADAGGGVRSDDQDEARRRQEKATFDADFEAAREHFRNKDGGK